jgi:glycosyltransferase involved in cell wall biosynthesis
VCGLFRYSLANYRGREKQSLGRVVFQPWAEADPNSARVCQELPAVDKIQSHFQEATGQSSDTKRVCMVTHSFYERDNRVMRYAEALVERGNTVEIFALRSGRDLPKEEIIFGVRLFRIQDRFEKKESSKISFLWPLLRFLFVSLFWVAKRHQKRRYDLVHVHNIPDFLVFSALYPKLSGCRVILDIHDIVPEFFGSKFGNTKGGSIIRALKLMEKISAAFADHVIIANDLWLDKYTSRSAPRKKCSVFVNNVDARIFRPRSSPPSHERPLILFPGGLQYHQGVDLAIQAFSKLRERLPEVEFHIYGDGIAKPDLVALATRLGLNGSVRFFNPLPIHEVASVIAGADLGVVPKRADSFGNEAYSTKIMEFMSVGVPVVVSNTKIDRFYFSDGVVRFFKSGDVDDLANAMHAVLTTPGLQRDLIANASEYVTRNSWETRKAEYLQLVDSLCQRS